MKMVLALGLVLLNFGAHAGTNVVCANPVLDATTVATFTNFGSSEVLVSLFVPTGETSGEVFTGTCTQSLGIEPYFSCGIMTSTDSGYGVTLYSTGGAELNATVTPWSMAGQSESFSLPCNRE